MCSEAFASVQVGKLWPCTDADPLSGLTIENCSVFGEQMSPG